MNIPLPNDTIFSDSPDAGDPFCFCSRCGKVIAEEDAPAIRVFTDDNQEYRYHVDCANEIVKLPILASDIKNLPYVPPLQTPLYWRNEESGKLPAAIEAFMASALNEGPLLTREQLSLVVEYLDYFIHAPCWRDSSDDGKLNYLRSQIRTLGAVWYEREVQAWIEDCLDLGIDPL